MISARLLKNLSYSLLAFWIAAALVVSTWGAVLGVVIESFAPKLGSRLGRRFHCVSGLAYPLKFEFVQVRTC